MASVDYPELRRRLKILDVLALAGWTPEHHGLTHWRGWCPFHSTFPHRSKIFSVSHQGEWYCHRCRVGGDALHFWKLWSHLDTHDAVRDVCRRLNLPVPYLPRVRRARPPRKQGRGAEGGEWGVSPHIDNSGAGAAGPVSPGFSPGEGVDS